jgi:methylated-DNA-[protein]-cysteine S-methyltransferase
MRLRSAQALESPPIKRLKNHPPIATGSNVSSNEAIFMQKITPLQHLQITTPLGPMLLAASSTGLAGAWFLDQRHFPDTTNWLPTPDHPLLQAAASQLHRHFNGSQRRFDIPLDLSTGTDFQQRVWHALINIRAGQTTSYGQLAAQLGLPSASRAVGAAVGRNPISIVVPCHRVLGSKGQLTGYAGGLTRKSALLQLEGSL